MEIYWQNKDKNQVDVLVERTMKALIANNQSCAVIYDCEDSQVLLDSGITAVDESQMFKIVFSPEKVICEVPFYEKTEKETKSIIAAIKKFGETFLHDVIEIAKKKNDFVRAEVIRIVWKYFNQGNVIPRSSKNINEEQKLLLNANKEFKKTGSKSYIPWKCIEGLWQGDDTEMMIVHNTKVFIEKFKEAANRENLLHTNGKVYYDLEEKLTDVQYCNLAMKECFESVFHKVKKGYEIQNEVRFSIICPDRPESFKLQLEKDSKLIFTLIPLKYGKDIMIELSELVFDKELNLPVKFSGDIKFYESEWAIK